LYELFLGVGQKLLVINKKRKILPFKREPELVVYNYLKIESNSLEKKLLIVVEKALFERNIFQNANVIINVFNNSSD
jgi:hypothetical protein